MAQPEEDHVQRPGVEEKRCAHGGWGRGRRSPFSRPPPPSGLT